MAGEGLLALPLPPPPPRAGPSAFGARETVDGARTGAVMVLQQQLRRIAAAAPAQHHGPRENVVDLRHEDPRCGRQHPCVSQAAAVWRMVRGGCLRPPAASCAGAGLKTPLAPCRLRLSTLLYALAFIAGGASTAYLTSLRYINSDHSFATHISISGNGGWSRKGLYISTGAPRRRGGRSSAGHRCNVEGACTGCNAPGGAPSLCRAGPGATTTAPPRARSWAADVAGSHD
jgi:hypothetical protein